MIKKLIAGVFVLSFGAAFAGMTNEGTVYTIDCTEDETIGAAIPADATEVIKTGTGTATLTVSSTAAGHTFVIQQGAISLAKANYIGTPTKLQIQEGGALYITEAIFFPKDQVTEVCGTGPDGAGAIRYTKNTGRYGVFYTLTMTDATLVYGQSLFTVCAGGAITNNNGWLDMGGHTLTIDGSFGFNTGSSACGFKLKNPGDIALKNGATLQFTSLNKGITLEGTSIAGKKIYPLGAKATVTQYMNRPACAVPWALEVTSGRTVTISSTSHGNAGDNSTCSWGGDWHIDGNVVINHSGTPKQPGNPCYLYKVNGKVSGTGSVRMAISGSDHDMGFNLTKAEPLSLGNLCFCGRTNMAVTVSSTSLTTSGVCAFSNLTTVISAPCSFGSLIVGDGAQQGLTDVDFSGAPSFAVSGETLISRGKLTLPSCAELGLLDLSGWATVILKADENGNLPSIGAFNLTGSTHSLQIDGGTVDALSVTGDVRLASMGETDFFSGFANGYTFGSLTLNGGAPVIKDAASLTAGAVQNANGSKLKIANVEAVELGSLSSGNAGSSVTVEGAEALTVSDRMYFSNGTGNFLFADGGTGAITNLEVASAAVSLCFSNAASLAFGTIAYGGGIGTRIVDCDAVTVDEMSTVSSGSVTFDNAGDVAFRKTYVPNSNGLLGNQVALRIEGNVQDENLPRVVFKGDTRVVTGSTGDGKDGMIAVAAAQNNKTTRARGILDIRDGAQVNSGVCIGNCGSYTRQAGAVYISGEDTVLNSVVSNRCTIGDYSNYGYIGMRSGTFNSNSGDQWMFARGGGRGYYVQYGGTFNRTVGTITLTRPNNWEESDTDAFQSHSKFIVFGGTATNSGGELRAFRENMARAEWATAELTVGGFDTPASFESSNFIYMHCPTNTPNLAFLAINVNSNGLLAASKISREAASGTTFNKDDVVNARLYLNFNGGTFKTKSVNAFPGEGHEATHVTVFEGGATIDTDGRNVACSWPFIRPTGYGIDKVTITDAAAFEPYAAIGATRVTVSGGTGEGATGITAFNEETMKIEGVIMTSSGFGYGANDQLTVKVEKCDASSACPAWAATATLKELATTGGFTKKGAGTLALNAVNTYGGKTRVEAGTLVFGVAGSLPAGSTIEIDKAALGTAAPVQLAAEVELDGNEIVITGGNGEDDAWLTGMVNLVSFGAPQTSVPTVKVVNAAGEDVTPADCRARLSADGQTLSFGHRNGLILLFR